MRGLGGLGPHTLTVCEEFRRMKCPSIEAANAIQEQGAIMHSFESRVSGFFRVGQLARLFTFCPSSCQWPFIV
ncbi:hypothetical protein HD806DRAFT_504775 [Xylariaceae sp. AK1471]|nr:hypothetical protein HD806DRAFT_504775 [Xylariaceae sp. AK1471]